MARITITLPDDLAARIEERKADPQDRSGEIAHILAHHFAVVALGRRRLAQKLSRPELMAVLDVMNGCYWDASILPMMLQGGISANVSDGCALDGTHETWEVDRDHLCHTVRDLSGLETFALLDLVHEFWNRTGADWDELASDFKPAWPGAGDRCQEVPET